MTATNDLTGKVILVTGASRGIGYQVALEAGRRGAHVIAVARTVGGLEDLDDAIKAAGGSATLVPLDLRDFDGIDRLGLSIFERWGHLDGLVGNAGMAGTLSPVGHIEPKDFESALALNVTANFRLIRSVDLLLRQAEAGRAVFISSGIVNVAVPYFGTYTATKMALDGLIRVYAAEMANTKVRVNTFNPGPLRTALRAKAIPGEDPMTLEPPSVVAPKIVDMVAPDWTENGMLFDYETGTSRPIATQA
ncbi:MAG: SDR family NAD(P)-dependent oxidoreductase [Devosia nanyangense]|uniref:SDR family NAD(P)-dependent oxidoreductase n=1 Tax=Devosia nanyangense TaxID=1228055 RepID=A0A933NVS4_9HYPH|nr:SDR family NAD(P)-dependent oxidoreductase [Devosia nanyangense]